MTREEFMEITGLTDAQLNGEKIEGIFDAPALTSIPEGVTLNIGGNFYAPALTTIPEGVTLNIGGNFDAPALTTIPEGVTLNIEGDFYARALTSIPKGVKIEHYDSKPIDKIKTIDLFHRVKYWSDNSRTFIKVDGIFSEVICHRGNVWRIRQIAQKKIRYLVSDGENYSHGNTLAEAREGLIYKISNRDTSQYEGMTIDTVLTFAQAVKAYRTITGSCEAGVRMFLDKKGIVYSKDVNFTIAAIIDLTIGEYGHETFKTFFNKNR